MRAFNLNNIPTSHRPALDTVLPDLINEDGVIAIMLMGSLVRGDFLPSSDIDLLVVTEEEIGNRLDHTIVSGIVVEIARHSHDDADERLSIRPYEPYRYLDGAILHDPNGEQKVLAEKAKIKAMTYAMPTGEIELTTIWLRKIRGKLLSAIEAKDTVLMGYLATMTSAEILNDLFAVNGRPPAPTGSTAYSRVHEFGLDDELEALFGGDAYKRASAAVKLIDYLLDRFGGK
jgi:predicted nucleotidyltransferase